MLFEIDGICRNCGEEVKITVHNNELLENCHECESPPFEMKQYAGCIYVVSNANQTGVKIGMTQKSVEQRIKSLNSTGVPGKFEPIVIFPSNRPRDDEKRVHARLKKKNIAKEHFDLSAVDAALGCYRALNRRKPIFYDKEVEEVFRLRLEQDRIQMQLRLKGKSGL